MSLTFIHSFLKIGQKHNAHDALLDRGGRNEVEALRPIEIGQNMMFLTVSLNQASRLESYAHSGFMEHEPFTYFHAQNPQTHFPAPP